MDTIKSIFIIFLIIAFWWFLISVSNSTNNNRTIIPDYSFHKKIFDENYMIFKKNYNKLLSNENFIYSKLKNNYKGVFDDIYSLTLFEPKKTFDEYFKLIKKIEYLEKNQEEIIKEIGYTHYRGSEGFYEFFNKYICEFNVRFFPNIQFVDLDEYFIFINELFKENKEYEIADKIGFDNTFFVYSILKNIDYLYLRTDIDIHQKTKLEEFLKKKINSINYKKW